MRKELILNELGKCFIRIFEAISKCNTILQKELYIVKEDP